MIVGNGMIYLHIGNNRNIRTKDVIGIFDADSATVSNITKKFLSTAEAEKKVKFASLEVPKSFVLYKDRKTKTVKICFSQLSSASLLGRTKI